MVKKKIYWICGYLRPDERDQDFLKYGLKLSQLFQSEARRNPALGDFEFKNIYTCTKREFAKIWSDPSTYGIFWDSHGDQYGRPQADPNLDLATFAEEQRSMDLDPRPKIYVVQGSSQDELKRQVTQIAAQAATRGRPYLVKGYDDARVVRRSDGRYEIEVTAAALPAASPNLKFIAFMSCWVGKQEDAWKQLMPPGARIPSFPEKNSTAPGAHRGWIDEWIDHLKVPQDLFRSLAPPGTRASGRLSAPSSDRPRSFWQRLLEGLTHAGTVSAPITAAPLAKRVLSTATAGARLPTPMAIGAPGAMFGPPGGATGFAGGAGSLAADIHSRFRRTPMRQPITIGTIGASAPSSARRVGGASSGLTGSALIADIHRRFGTDPWWKRSGATDGRIGGRGIAGGVGIGDLGIVRDIRSRFRTTPTRKPLGPPPTAPQVHGEVTFGPVTLTYSPRRTIIVPGRF